MIENLLANLATVLVTSKMFISTVGWVLLFTVVFWLVWINLNVLHNRLQTRTGWRKIVMACVFYPLLPFGALVDVLYNKTIGTLLFWDWGCESTLSMRITRYISRRTCNKLGIKDYGYRVPIAVWISTHLVEPWQPGHIGIEKYGYPPAKNLIDGLSKRLKKLLP